MDQLQPHADSREPSALIGRAAQEYLEFVLGAEHYVIDILRVQEIRGYSHVTHIANAPEHFKGIVNLRGVIVPILDLRIRFGHHAPTYNDQTIVIVLNVLDRVIGVVVDAVSDVVKIRAEDILPPPQLGASAMTEHIVGVASHDEHMLIVLDIERALSQDHAHSFDLVAPEHLN